jgi:hypothetical protein
MRVNSFHGFALRAGSGALAIARRPLSQPLAVGASFTVNFDSNLLDTGRTVGFSLADSNQVNRFTFFARGGTPHVYGIRDGAGTSTNTGIPYTVNGILPVNFTLTASNTYRLTAGTNTPITGTLTVGAPISRLVASNNSAGNGIANSLYLGDMTVRSVLTTNELVRAAAPAVVRSVETTDGLPNSWWETYFPGSSNAWSASGDPDGDGHNNAMEQAAGTSPVDATSKLVVTDFERGGNSLAISWSAVAYRTYHVESVSSLPGTNWHSLGTLTAPEGATSLSTNVAMDGPTGFLRVRAVPSP